MQFHNTRLGGFGAGLPANNAGYVTCSPTRVKKARSGLRTTKERESLVQLYGATNVLVAEAEEALEAWRKAARWRAEGRPEVTP